MPPSEANALIVAGRVAAAFAPVLREFYARLAAPRWGIAVGTCALSDVFDTIPTAQVIPVDIALPGCTSVVQKWVVTKINTLSASRWLRQHRLLPSS